MKINQKGNKNENKKIRKAKSTFCNLNNYYCRRLLEQIFKTGQHH